MESSSRAMRVAVVAALTAIVVAAAGCKGQTPQSLLTRGEGTRGSTEPIEATVGQVFHITLESNPTTGYRWQLAEPLDESIVTLEDSKYKAPKTDRVGAGGKEIWTFKVVGPGKTRISMKYVRPWEKDKPPAKKQTIEVVVH